MGNADAYDRLIKELRRRGLDHPSQWAAFLGVTQQRIHNWQSRGLSDPGAKMAAPLIGWTFDKLWYGPKPSDVSAMPQRNALLGELRRARLGAIIVALQDDKNAVTALWGQIDDLLAHWERWIVPQYRAAGPGAALPRAAPGQKRKRG